MHRSLVIVFCLVLAIGHLNLSQGLAWISMLAARSQSMPIGQALSTTFDGSHPCSLCAMVKAERANDEKTPAPTAKEKKQFECLYATVTVPVPAMVGTFQACDNRPNHPAHIVLEPPTPPPRLM